MNYLRSIHSALHKSGNNIFNLNWLELSKLAGELNFKNKIHQRLFCRTVEEYANQISHYSTATLNPLNSYLLVKKLIKQWEIISLLATANDRLGKFVANKFITTRKINSVN
jgi:hypothetical protein